MTDAGEHALFEVLKQVLGAITDLVEEQRRLADGVNRIADRLEKVSVDLGDDDERGCFVSTRED
jgi:hypothetical protein